MFSRRSLDAYRKNSLRAELSVADPYVITKMLYQGAFERLAQAKGAIEHGDMELKAKKLSSATTIIESLKNTLDFSVNSQLAQRLFDLYTFMLDRIADAAIEVSSGPIDSALKVLLPLKDAWDSIPLSEQQKAAAQRRSQDKPAYQGPEMVNSLASGSV